jgi:hypothetical protein
MENITGALFVVLFLGCFVWWIRRVQMRDAQTLYLILWNQKLERVTRHALDRSRPIQIEDWEWSIHSPAQLNEQGGEIRARHMQQGTEQVFPAGEEFQGDGYIANSVLREWPAIELEKDMRLKMYRKRPSLLQKLESATGWCFIFDATQFAHEFTQLSEIESHLREEYIPDDLYIPTLPAEKIWDHYQVDPSDRVNRVIPLLSWWQKAANELGKTIAVIERKSKSDPSTGYRMGYDQRFVFLVKPNETP